MEIAPLKAEYEICLRRGHQPSDTMLDDKNICRWCGTIYWYTREVHEQRTPFDEVPGPLREER